MIRYVFKEDEPIRIKAAAQANAQVIGEAIEAIKVAAGGRLQPEDVVQAARGADHPLHPHFEWNDSAAADAYRRDQARNLIRIVRVADEGEKDPPRAFLSVSDAKGVAYRSLADVQQSEDFRTAVMRQAEKDLLAFEHRYKQLKDICEMVRKTRETVQRRLAKNESRAAA